MTFTSLQTVVQGPPTTQPMPWISEIPSSFHIAVQALLGEQLNELLALLLPPLLHIYQTVIWFLVETQKEIKSYF